MHLISKLRDYFPSNAEGGARIGIILNGSPLFTGGAGSGESEIRRYILEADLLEAIIALPTDMFYNTGIATYIWVLSNKKSAQRKGKVQLINGVHLYGKMRKSLGSKRNLMSDEDIATITRNFGAFEAVEAQALDKTEEPKSNRGRQSENPKTETPKTFSSKIFDTHEFGYRRITIERPLRKSYQFSDERIEECRYSPINNLNEAMKWAYAEYAQSEPQKAWTDKPDCPHYGKLQAFEEEIRQHIKQYIPKLKEAQIKDLLNPKTWQTQKDILLKAKALQAKIGTAQYDDKNDYAQKLKETGVKLDTKQKKQITDAVSWKNPEAAKMIKKVHITGEANLYGIFEVDGRLIEYKVDTELRDYENVALDPTRSVNEINESYFKKEVQPHVPEAWIDANKRDEQDKEIGIVGYEIPFNRHFYVYQPPRDLAEIDADLDKVSAEIMELLREVHS